MELKAKIEYLEGILKHRIKHYKIYYCLAASYIKNNDYKSAKINIDNALKLIDNSNDDELFNLPIELIAINTIKVSNVFQLAGYIYSNFSEKEAMEYYIRFQHQLQLEYINEKKEHYPQDRFILYSFRNYSVYSLADLINNTITFVEPSKMNDPIDTIAIEWSKQDNLSLVSKHKQQIPIYSKSYNYYRIRSFTANKTFSNCDKKVFGDTLMWSHYANSHTGYCVKYNLSRDFVFNNNSSLNKTRVLLPIKYSKEHKHINSKTIKFQNAFITKAKVWEKEREVRLLSYNPTTHESFAQEKLDSNSWISEIAFGCNCSQENINSICNILKNDHKISFVKMELDKENIFKLIPKKYNINK